MRKFFALVLTLSIVSFLLAPVGSGYYPSDQPNTQPSSKQNKQQFSKHRANLNNIPPKCPACQQVSDQTIYAPLIELPESTGTEINLNCRSPHALDVTPTFYTQRGEAIVGNTFQMQPAEVKTVDLRSLMPASVRNRHDWGGMTLSYNGVMLEMWAQLRLMHVRSGNSVDVTFSIPQDKRSAVRKAVWWMPAHGAAVIALGNLAASPITATVQFSNGDSENVAIPAYGTSLIRKRSEQLRLHDGDGKPATVSIVAQGQDGSTGSLIATGAVTSDDGGYTSSIRFYDTQNVAQPNLYATNFRLHNVAPRMVLNNTGTQAILATPRFLPAPGDPNNFVELPAVALQPNETADVDLTPLKQAARGRTDLDEVSVQVLSSGTAGALIGALNGTDTQTGMTYDVPLRDIGAVRNSTGAYPWRLDHDLSTIVSITNTAPVASEFFVQINYEGGPYVLNPRSLKPGETVTYNLRQIRDQQIPDSKGHTIPLTVTGGQFKWFIHGAGSGRLIGRAEMLGLSESISSSYSCAGGGCPAVFGGVYVEPGYSEITVGDSIVMTAIEEDVDGAGNQYYYQASGTWTDFNSSVASLIDFGSYAVVTAISSGLNDDEIGVMYENYAWDGFECVDGGQNTGTGDGVVSVKPQIDDLSPNRGLAGTTVTFKINGSGFKDEDSGPDPEVIIAGEGSGKSLEITSMSATSDQITITMKIAVNAAEGNHSVQVKANNQTSNSVNYYVQYPRKLIRQDFPEQYQQYVTQESTGMSPKITLTDGSVIGFDGQPLTANNQPLTHRCGAYRLLLYQLVDAEGQDILPGSNVTVKVDEDFPANEQSGNTSANLLTSSTLASDIGYVVDLNGITEPVGSCLTQAVSWTGKQHFKVTVGNGTTPFTLSTIVQITFSFSPPNTYTVTNSITTP